MDNTLASRHFLGKALVHQPGALRNELQFLEQLAFCLLHAPRGIGIADGCGNPFQRVHTQPFAQVLRRFVQQRQSLQRGLVALVPDAPAPFSSIFTSAWAQGR